MQFFDINIIFSVVTLSIILTSVIFILLWFKEKKKTEKIHLHSDNDNVIQIQTEQHEKLLSQSFLHKYLINNSSVKIYEHHIENILVPKLEGQYKDLPFDYVIKFEGNVFQCVRFMCTRGIWHFLDHQLHKDETVLILIGDSDESVKELYLTHHKSEQMIVADAEYESYDLEYFLKIFARKMQKNYLLYQRVQPSWNLCGPYINKHKCAYVVVCLQSDTHLTLIREFFKRLKLLVVEIPNDVADVYQKTNLVNFAVAAISQCNSMCLYLALQAKIPTLRLENDKLEDNTMKTEIETYFVDFPTKYK